MKFSNKQIQTRAEKIEYLKGLQSKSRNPGELNGPLVIMLEYRDDQPDNVLNRTTGKHITLVEANGIRSKTYKNTLVCSVWKTYLEADPK